MKKIKDFLKKYKWIMLANLFIFVLFIILMIYAKSYGIDYYNANSYEFSDGTLAIDGTFNTIVNNLQNWNIKIGQLMLYLIGSFPPVFYYIANAFFFVLFINLIPFYAFGSKFKDFLTSKKYYTCIFFIFASTVIACPIFNINFIQMASTCNNTWGAIILLLLLIPFRFLLEGVDIFKKHPITQPIYYITSIFLCANCQNMVPVIIGLMLIISIIYYVKKKKIDCQWPIFTILCASFGCYMIVTSDSVRWMIDIFKGNEWAISTKKTILSNFWQNYAVFVYMACILTSIYLYQNAEKKLKKDYWKMLIFLGGGIASLFLIYFEAFYTPNVTILAFFFLLIYITYLIFDVFTLKYRKIYPYLLCLCTILSSAYVTILYYDYDKFTEIRFNYIEEQLAAQPQGTAEIKCITYDNKIPNRHYLWEVDVTYCNGDYLKKLTNRDINISYSDEKKR